MVVYSANSIIPGNEFIEFLDKECLYTIFRDLYLSKELFFNCFNIYDLLVLQF